MATREEVQKTVLNPNAPEFYPKIKGKLPELSHAASEVNTATTKTGNLRYRQVAWIPSRPEWRVKVRAESLTDQKKLLASVNPDCDFTTVMIRNIPCNYTRDMLVEHLDKFCMVENKKLEGQESDQLAVAFDFLYLPVDFKNGKCLGYAFANFTDAKAVWKFFLGYQNKTREHFSSKKICKIAYARLQGKDQLLRHFMSSRFACASNEWLPVTFNPARDGSDNKAVEINMVGKRVYPPRRRDVPRRGRVDRNR